MVPTVAVVARGVKGQTVAGYQLAVYLDKPTARIQLILADLDSKNNYKTCIDGVVLSKHKVTVRNHLTSSLWTLLRENENHHCAFLNRLKLATELHVRSTPPPSLQRQVSLVRGLQLASEWVGTKYQLPSKVLWKSARLHLEYFRVNS